MRFRDNLLIVMAIAVVIYGLCFWFLDPYPWVDFTSAYFWTEVFGSVTPVAGYFIALVLFLFAIGILIVMAAIDARRNEIEGYRD